MNEPESIAPSIPLHDTTMNALMSRESFAGLTLKRRASSSFEGLEEDSSRKRMKESQYHTVEPIEEFEATPIVGNSSITLANELAQELQCGCCSELVYRPVIVTPCQHFFCGR